MSSLTRRTASVDGVTSNRCSSRDRCPLLWSHCRATTRALGCRSSRTTEPALSSAVIASTDVQPYRSPRAQRMFVRHRSKSDSTRWRKSQTARTYDRPSSSSASRPSDKDSTAISSSTTATSRQTRVYISKYNNVSEKTKQCCVCRNSAHVFTLLLLDKTLDIT